jgi:hypothetical protein
MDRGRRRFLQVSAAAGIGLTAGALSLLDAAAQGWPRAEWADDDGAPFAPARLHVLRGTAQAGTTARLRILIDDGTGERELESLPVVLDDRRRTLTWPLVYPFAELRDVTLRYTLLLETGGFGAVRSAPLAVQTLRYRFGC